MERGQGKPSPYETRGLRLRRAAPYGPTFAFCTLPFALLFPAYCRLLSAYCFLLFAQCSLPGFLRRLNHQCQAFNFPYANTRALGDAPGGACPPQFAVHDHTPLRIEVGMRHTL